MKIEKKSLKAAITNIREFLNTTMIDILYVIYAGDEKYRNKIIGKQKTKILVKFHLSDSHQILFFYYRVPEQRSDIL